MSTFVVATDSVLVERIETARRRIVFVAPGLSGKVANALASRFAESAAPSITIILDADPEVFRMGYGDPAALEVLHAAAKANQGAIQHQSGIRIGLLMTDEALLVYSPTPQLIEAGSNSPSKPNAIEVVDDLPKAIAKAVGEEGVALPSEAEIGVTAVRDELIADVKRDLAQAPPRDFNVARRERVFNSLLEYVEFEVHDFQISATVVSIPPELLGLASTTQSASRWRNGFKIFDANDRLEVEMPRTQDDVHLPAGAEIFKYGIRDIDRERKEIAGRFLLVVPNFDVLIPRSERSKFDQRIERYSTRLKQYAKKVEEEIKKRIDEAKKQLLAVILPQVIQNPPEDYLRRTLGGRSAEELRQLVAWDIDQAFRTASGSFNPRVVVRYKSLTYETILNPEFRAALERKVPPATIARMFQEHEAVASESSRRVIPVGATDTAGEN